MGKTRATTREPNTSDLSATKDILTELQNIRAVLMAISLKIGVTTNELGAALSLSGQRIRQMIPASRIKKLAITSPRDESNQ